MLAFDADQWQEYKQYAVQQQMAIFTSFWKWAHLHRIGIALLLSIKRA